MLRSCCALSLASAIAIGGTFWPPGGRPASVPRVRVAEAAERHFSTPKVSGTLPRYFEANRGQTDRQVKFLSRGSHDVIFLTPTEVVLVLAAPSHEPAETFQKERGSPRTRLETLTPTVLRMTFAGANPDPRVTGLEEGPGKVNYFIGNDPTRWRTQIPTYARVQYGDVFPGIDVGFYARQHGLEYDFMVRPGANPSKIALKFEGAQKMDVTARGDLVLHMHDGAVWQEKPVLYQVIDGVRRAVSARYMLRTAHEIGFRVSRYDTGKPLVIDPVLAFSHPAPPKPEWFGGSTAATLAYSTYLGGSGIDQGTAIAVDGAGSVYVTGFTFSTDFPTTTGALQRAYGGGDADAFVAKLNPVGGGAADLIYSTYLGGNDLDEGRGITVDSAGDAFVTGSTRSTNFPTTPGAFQTAYGGGDADAFVTKLSPDGSRLLYSTYLGGSGDDFGLGIAVDGAGMIYLTGSTTNMTTSLPPPFPTVNASQPAYGGGTTDAFAAKLNPVGGGAADLIYSTYLGGSGADAGTAIAVDSSGNIYVTGFTSSGDFPTTTGAFQTTSGGGATAFVTKLDSTGARVYSTYLGGGDQGFGIAVDGPGNAYVTGSTGPNFPVTTGQTTYGGGSTNAFVAKLNASGSALVYATFLGGSGTDRGNGIALDSSGAAYVTGVTTSTDFPTANGFQMTCGGCPSHSNAFVAAIDPTGATIVYSTYLGGTGDDAGQGITVDGGGDAFVTGFTESATTFPTTPGAFQTTFGGGFQDAFVAKVVPAAAPPPPCDPCDPPPPDPPTFSPSAGTYNGPQSVSLSDAASGATIYYTTDGSTPTTASPVYSGPISVTQTTTINAFAAANGSNSNVASATYTIVPQAAPPAFNPPGGQYTLPVLVSISDASPGVTIYYTTNGSTPTTASPVYTGPILVATTTTIKAIAVGSGVSQSPVAGATYTTLL